MFISGGENVYPAEVERALVKASGVSEAAVVGVPDERWGEVGKAFLVVEEGTSLDAVREYCTAQLAKFKVPRYFNCLTELPKNGSGKIDRKKLKEL
jgi:fatty-acyl-CoA synthase